MQAAAPPFLIDGLRLLPAWQRWKADQRSKSPSQIIGPAAGCEGCKATTDVPTRQWYRCPYEPAGGTAQPPVPDGVTYPPDADPHLWPTACPEYTTSLPETIEVARAWNHWDKGALRDFCEGRATQAMLEGVELFDGWVNELRSKLMTPRSRGGLAEDSK